LEKEFEIMATKHEAIIEEKRKAIEAAKKREEEIVKRDTASKAIQSAWKSFLYRKNRKKKAQKKAAKRGKAKGKK
jgi:hypothetical protein